MQNRRQFVERTLLFLGVLMAPFTMVACNVFSDILAWVPIGIAAVNGIVTVLGAFMPPGATAVIALVKAAFADLTATITQYQQDTNPADKATWEAKIATILNDIAANFQSFLNSLNLGNNPIEAIVIGLANVFLAAIAGFLGQLPSTSKTLAMTARVGTKSFTVVPKFYKKASDFKKDWNAVCSADGHPEIELK